MNERLARESLYGTGKDRRQPRIPTTGGPAGRLEMADRVEAAIDGYIAEYGDRPLAAWPKMYRKFFLQYCAELRELRQPETKYGKWRPE